MNFSEIKEVITKAAQKAGLSDYDVYYSKSSDVSTETLKNDISGFSSSDSIGIGFRCIVNGKFGQASCEYITKEELESLVYRAAENAAFIECDDEAVIFKGSENYIPVETEDFVIPSAGRLKDIALDIQSKTYNKNELVVDGTQSGAGAGVSEVYLFNSYGLELRKSAGFVNYYSCPVVSDGKETEDGCRFEMSKSFDDVDKAVEKAVSSAVDKLGADSVKSGSYNVVIDGKEFSDLISEFCGCFSSKQVKLGLSKFADKIGCKVAADFITITDDPFSEHLCGKNSFDGEGVATYKKNLVENGELKTYLYDLAMAKYFGTAPTGNASRGYSSPVSISPYFLYLNKGSKSFDQLVDEAGSGIYVTELKSFSASNAVTGDFSIESAGYLIENGKIGSFVKNFTIAGNFFELLLNVDSLSDELKIKHSGVYRGFASPDVLVKNISVAGK
jgi:PmbA protein